MVKKKPSEPSGKPGEVKELSLSTGSTLLNLAVSDRVDGGFRSGHYYFYVGSSSSGKSWLSLAGLAEASIDPLFDDYQLVYGDVEGGALMDVERYFGRRLKSRLLERRPVTVEDFYYGLDDLFDEGKPFVYVLDSMDALRAEDDEDKYQEQRKAAASGKEVGGSYGTAKAKANSSFLPHVISRLRKTGSILLVISQTRQNVGYGSQFKPWTRSGGTSLTFYATLELWTSLAGEFTRTVGGSERNLGVYSEVHVKKNRQSGKDRTVTVPILNGVGVDDPGSLVDWLVAEGRWEKRGGGFIEAPEFDSKGRREDLVEKIERENRGQELRELAQKVWDEIEEACRVKRKGRYDG